MPMENDVSEVSSTPCEKKIKTVKNYKPSQINIRQFAFKSGNSRTIIYNVLR